MNTLIQDDQVDVFRTKQGYTAAAAEVTQLRVALNRSGEAYTAATTAEIQARDAYDCAAAAGDLQVMSPLLTAYRDACHVALLSVREHNELVGLLQVAETEAQIRWQCARRALTDYLSGLPYNPILIESFWRITGNAAAYRGQRLK